MLRIAQHLTSISANGLVKAIRAIIGKSSSGNSTASKNTSRSSSLSESNKCNKLKSTVQKLGTPRDGCKKGATSMLGEGSNAKIKISHNRMSSDDSHIVSVKLNKHAKKSSIQVNLHANVNSREFQTVGNYAVTP